MNIDFLLDYTSPIIMGICLCIGFILKEIIPSTKINRYIPLIMGTLGVLLAWWINGAMDPVILLSGLISGLASTGLYEAFKNLICKNVEAIR